MILFASLPFLPSEELGRSEVFFGKLGFVRQVVSVDQLRLVSGGATLIFNHLPGHVRMAGTQFSGRTVALATDDVRAARRCCKAADIEWQGWTPPHLGHLEKRDGRDCFAFSDPDGNLIWIEQARAAPTPVKGE